MGMNHRNKKGKRKSIEKEYGLKVTIFDGEGIDDPSVYREVRKRQYRTLLWVGEERVCRTCKVEGNPNPEWKEQFYFRLDKLMDDRFLHVQVVRLGSNDVDPGTSTGTRLVGKVQIPIPKFGVKKAGRFGLVRFHQDYFKAEGHIVLSMEQFVI